MKFLLKGYCHSKCSRLHSLKKDKEKEFDKFILNVKDQIKDQDFQQGAANVDP